MKQGEETTKLVKENHNPTEEYILQKNRKTKIGTYIITAILLVIIVALILSAANIR